MSENVIFLSPKDVEAFLKRERDEHGKESYWWRSLDEALDAFRLHMVTGTPLTEPKPEGGPEALGVGKEPLTEAEELRAELVEARRDAHDARIDYNLARTRADKAEAERDRLRAELARRDRVAAEPMDDALRLHTSCVECMDRPVVPGSDFCPDCKELVAAESSSPSGEQG